MYDYNYQQSVGREIDALLLDSSLQQLQVFRSELKADCARGCSTQYLPQQREQEGDKKSIVFCSDAVV